MNSNDNNQNPLLAMAMGLMDSIAPGALENPEKAMRELVPRLRFLVIAQMDDPTVLQLKALQALDDSRNLPQIRQAIQAGELRFGPFPGDLAEGMFIRRLVELGLMASLRELTDEEKAQQFRSLGD